MTKETTKYALRRAMEQIVPPHVLQPAQARLPGADPALAGRARCTTGRGRSSTDSADRRVAGPGSGAGACWTRTGAGAGSTTRRKIWTLLVFMIWHGIFVEERITPAIPEPVYPVRL